MEKFKQTVRQEIQSVIRSAITDMRFNRRRIIVSRGTPGIVPATHFHLTPEIFIQISGSTLFECPGHRFTARQGDIVIIPPFVRHQETARGKFRNLVCRPCISAVSLHFARGISGRAPEACESFPFETSLAGVWANQLQETLKLREKAMGLPPGVIEQTALLSFFTPLSISLEEGHTSSGESPYSFKVQQAIEIVRRKMNQPQLSVKFVAAQLQCSADYLSHLFCQETGHRLSSFIHRERINQAQALLAQPELNIFQVAQAVGFCDQGHFSRIYKSVTGKTPREHRHETHTL